MTKVSSPSVYQLKVTLAHVRPAVWRRLLVPSSVKLHQFHDILQVAMGWTDSHLHQFEAQGQLYGEPDPEFGLSVKDETRVPLGQVLPQEGASMLYEYDFGDGWIHQIVLEKILPASAELKVPSCIAGARACPPEDCGGAGGYAEFLKAIKDPSHPEHEEMLEWSGGDFDPASFDTEAMNKFFASRKGWR
ncbi:MAG TPA: plasmid pRiA4b ORF-3 family protein [Verrucomicrobiales bacterium]|nr:plasmid pRiA4b ORF-3 family protein [Verrucomicrobiales bacterium]